MKSIVLEIPVLIHRCYILPRRVISNSCSPVVSFDDAYNNFDAYNDAYIAYIDDAYNNSLCCNASSGGGEMILLSSLTLNFLIPPLHNPVLAALQPTGGWKTDGCVVVMVVL